MFGEECIDAVPVLAVDNTGGNRIDIDFFLDELSPADCVRLMTAAFVAQ